MKEITVSFPLRETAFEEDLERANALAEEVGRQFTLQPSDTGVGFGQRDVGFELPDRDERDAGHLAVEIASYLQRQGAPEATVEVTFDDEHEMTLRAKWAMDGAATLAEAAQKLRAYAEELEELAQRGWELEGPIEDDYGFARKEGR